MDTKVQKNMRDAAIQRIIGAKKGGRHLSCYDDREFGVSEMHTVFCRIRRKIEDGKIPGYIMRSAWQTTLFGIRYKTYWFEDENKQD